MTNVWSQTGSRWPPQPTQLVKQLHRFYRWAAKKHKPWAKHRVLTKRDFQRQLSLEWQHEFLHRFPRSSCMRNTRTVSSTETKHVSAAQVWQQTGFNDLKWKGDDKNNNLKMNEMQELYYLVDVLDIYGCKKDECWIHAVL